ncbi:MAG: NAD(P)H-dependent oxidoreductase [Thermoleophilia bacterium]|nr:NAD(P)H-dependent oxidoreductase [Thermoleophilia bacterium]
MRILIIDGHPNPDSLCAAIVDRYRRGARAAGAHVDVVAVRDMDFDPILHLGYRGAQDAEPDVLRAREAIEAADHVCVATPVWWGATPALLKGFLDRVLERGWAFRYTERGFPQGLLKGRSGHLLLTSDSPTWYLRLVAGDTTARAMTRATLRFCGIRPVRLVRFANVHGSTPATRRRWLERAEREGARAVAGSSRRARRPAGAAV